MNATIARIVDIMFQDTEMNDEAQALHDEVMNNCQERFDDLVARGLSEDEAIGEVVESLKGMDEVIDQYPKKAAKAEDEAFAGGAADNEEQGACDFAYDREQVRELNVFLSNEDITVEPSEDGLVHVNGDVKLDVSLEAGVLSINGRPGERNRRSRHVTIHGENIHIDEPLTMENLGSFIRATMRAVSEQVKMSGTIHWGDGQITVQLPKACQASLNIHTSSGDVDIHDVSARRVKCDSSSGDVNISEVAGMETLHVNTSSGEIQVEGADDGGRQDEVSLKSMSGDVNFTGVCRWGMFTSVSGDVDVEGDLEDVQMKSTSGDVLLEQWEAGLRRVSIQSTSGDVTVHLPGDTCGVVANLSSVSGDRHCDSFPPARHGEQLLITARTISGDIRVDRG